MEVDAKRLLRAIKAVSPAISTDTTRPNMCRMLIEVGDNVTRFVTTDGHVLHKSTIGTCESPPWTREVTPACVKSILRALRLLHKRGNPTVVLTPESLLVGGSTIKLERCTEGQQPPWRRLVPSPNSLLGGERVEQVFDPELIARACTAAALYRITNHEEMAASLKMYFGEYLDPCLLQCETADGDTFEAVIMPRRS